MWIDYRRDLQPLFEGGQNAIGQAMWVVLRIMRLGEYSSYWNADRKEAIGGPKWKYDDYRARVIWIPGASIKSDDTGSSVVLNAGVENTDVRVYAVQFKDLIRPGTFGRRTQDKPAGFLDAFLGHAITDHLFKAFALGFVFDLQRNADMSGARHVHQVARRNRQLRGQACAF